MIRPLRDRILARRVVEQDRTKGGLFIPEARHNHDRPGEFMSRPKSISPSRSNQEDLETRVANRKRELITEIIEFKKSSRVDAAESIERLKARLSDLAFLMKEGVVDGWANVGERSRVKLDAWIAR